MSNEPLLAIANAVETLVSEFDFMEDQEWAYGDRALNVADRVAKLENEDVVIRDLSDNLGEVDHYSVATVYACAAERAVGALGELIGQSEGLVAGSDVLDSAPSGKGKDKAYAFINQIIDDMVDDAVHSAGVALNRKNVLLECERSGDWSVDENGAVHGVLASALESPSAKSWSLEFAQYATGFLEAYMDDPEAEDDPMIDGFDRRVFTLEVVRDATVSFVTGMAGGHVSTKYDEFEAAYDEFLSDLPGQRQGASTSGDTPTLLIESLALATEVLARARELAAFCTAHSALHACLSPD